ncbi:MAG: hypothetical protein ACLPUT_04570 [Solirubrobacteraceae bacterium]
MSRSRLILIGLFAVLTASAVTSTSASALQWYVKGVVLSGVLKIEAKQLGDAVLKDKIAGVAGEFVCSALSDSGTIDNGGTPALGLGLVLLDYKGCTVPKPAGCKILNELISTTAKLDLGTISGKPYALFSPDPSGSVFTLIPVRGCSEEANYTLEGELVGLVNNARRTIEFENKGVNNKLRLGGKEAEVESDDFVLMEGGGAFEAK